MMKHLTVPKYTCMCRMENNDGLSVHLTMVKLPTFPAHTYVCMYMYVYAYCTAKITFCSICLEPYHKFN